MMVPYLVVGGLLFGGTGILHADSPVAQLDVSPQGRTPAGLIARPGSDSSNDPNVGTLALVAVGAMAVSAAAAFLKPIRRKEDEGDSFTKEYERFHSMLARRIDGLEEAIISGLLKKDIHGVGIGLLVFYHLPSKTVKFRVTTSYSSRSLYDRFHNLVESIVGNLKSIEEQNLTSYFGDYVNRVNLQIVVNIN